MAAETTIVASNGFADDLAVGQELRIGEGEISGTIDQFDGVDLSLWAPAAATVDISAATQLVQGGSEVIVGSEDDEDNDATTNTEESVDGDGDDSPEGDDGDSSEDDDDDNDDDDDDSSNNGLWWIVGGIGVAGLWYLLYRLSLIHI